MEYALHETDGHIKPTAVTADAYLQHQSNKQSHRTTDPLADLLDNINKNLGAYANKQALKSVTKNKQCNGQINNKSLQQEAKNIRQCTKKADISHEEGTDTSRENSPTTQESEVRRSGCIIKKPDRLTYI